MPSLAQIIISVTKSVSKVNCWYRRFFHFAFPVNNITMSEFVRSIIPDYRIPFSFYQNFKLHHKLKNFVFNSAMKMPFSAIKSIKSKKFLYLDFHKNIIAEIWVNVEQNGEKGGSVFRCGGRYKSPCSRKL